MTGHPLDKVYSDSTVIEKFLIQIFDLRFGTNEPVISPVYT